MMVMTAKVNPKKIFIALAAAAGLIIALILTLGGGKKTDPAAVTTMSDNSSRVQFLKDFLLKNIIVWLVLILIKNHLK